MDLKAKLSRCQGCNGHGHIATSPTSNELGFQVESSQRCWVCPWGRWSSCCLLVKMVPKPLPTPNIPSLPGSGCRLMFPLGVGPWDSGARVAGFLLVSLVVLVAEGLGGAGGAPVTQSNVVVLAVEERWVLGVTVFGVAGAGWTVPPGAGGLVDASGVLVLCVVTTALGTTLVVVVAPCVTAGGGTELGEVALGLTVARMVLGGVAAGWREHGTMGPAVGAGWAVEVTGELAAVLGTGVSVRGGVRLGVGTLRGPVLE